MVVSRSAAGHDRAAAARARPSSGRCRPGRTPVAPPAPPGYPAPNGSIWHPREEYRGHVLLLSQPPSRCCPSGGSNEPEAPFASSLWIRQSTICNRHTVSESTTRPDHACSLPACATKPALALAAQGARPSTSRLQRQLSQAPHVDPQSAHVLAPTDLQGSSRRPPARAAACSTLDPSPGPLPPALDTDPADSTVPYWLQIWAAMAL